ncbi:proline--tRNA ligase [Halobacteriovorax vibrionivorans]|uniref:Proline--tRNA ligase n=1 Tax=Halobacteriovorax vibrionivorans TaxID=2152716 RepID=A0ABY0IK59_9BACT|nr:MULTISPECIES: proline--tRNA ligase [Halobacteriovorax]RZF22950.1 proline--tRNA ligase [Halobacteriovorax vibrionivorans]TGD46907.1 proline--tRNA ligase [Halobacteriovorax sp. Y22]
MILSKGFWQTYKEVPADATIASHQLMMRAGLIHKSAAGLYNYLPMGYRSIRKVEQIVREEMDKAGCYEMLMSVVTPGELWQETGRWEKMGGEMLKFKDKADRDLCISPTNEEAITDVFRKTIKSYKDLPLSLYQINTKFRDEIRPRFGLMRGREFIMKDAYTFHATKECLDEVYDRMYEAYENVFNRLGLEFSAVVADGGAMADGDAKTHEFQVIADSGEDAIIYSNEANYAANIETAKTIRKVESAAKTGSMAEVSTPGKATIKEVCEFLKKNEFHSLKSLVYKARNDEEEKFILVLLLGDDELNELKLEKVYPGYEVTTATDTELKALGLIKGFIGPVEISNLDIVFDTQVDLNAAYVVGANKLDMHLENFVPKEVIKQIKTADLRLACSGDYTVDGKHQVELKRGIEVGHIFQLGDKYTKGMDATILDQNGKAMAPLMGCYGIGVTRLVAAAIEQNHDENGIIWPAAIAPYNVSFVAIVKSEEYKEKANELYKTLINSGLEVVYDDRKAGPGFKFKDADLLGLPLQVVLGERDHKEDGMLEIRIRRSGEKIKVSQEDLISKVNELLKEL